MGPADVVGGADQPQAGGEGGLGTGDGPTSSREGRKVGAEGGVEALDVGRVDDRTGGRCRQHRLDPRQGAVDDPAGDADDVPLGRVLDDLGELEPHWQHQPWASAPPSADRLAEDLQEGGDVAGQTIDADQDRPGSVHRPGPAGPAE